MSQDATMAVEWRLGKILAQRASGADPLSQSELARRTGISFTTINAIAQGNTARVDRATLNALCRELRVTPGDLLVYVPDAPAPPSKRRKSVDA